MSAALEPNSKTESVDCGVKRVLIKASAEQSES
jgi:hypothetical protein